MEALQGGLRSNAAVGNVGVREEEQRVELTLGLNTSTLVEGKIRGEEINSLGSNEVGHCAVGRKRVERGTI